MTPAPRLRLYDMLPHALIGLTTLFSFIYLQQARKARPSWLPHLLDPLVKRAQAVDERPDADLLPEDEIEYQPPKPPQKDILGGAGSYAALGARLLSPSPAQSRAVGWIVDRGSDFPPAVTTLIDSWDTTAVFRDDPDRLTTRGWNGYIDDNETRAFRYTTPKRRLVAADLSGTPLLQSSAFHIICSPSRCRGLVTDLLTLRRSEAPPPGEEGGYTRPVIIWEPVPDLCTPDELLNLTNCLPVVDVCSPNHSELAGFLGDTGLDPETGAISTAAVEQACEQLLGSMPLSSFTLVIRAGERGCYIARNGGRGAGAGKKQQQQQRRQVGHHGGLQPDTDMMSLFAGLWQHQQQQQSAGEGDGDGEEEDWEEDSGDSYSFIPEEEEGDDDDDDDDEVEIDPGLDRWIPAYFTKETQDRVIDPTGGGNTFLGGLAVALARGKGMEEAATWASVAASFAIEQVGVPELGRDEDGEETWNGVRVSDRLSEFQERIGLSPT